MTGAPLAVSAATAEVLRVPALRAEQLSRDELHRAAAFRRPADRDDFVAAHLLVRLVAARVGGVVPEEVRVAQHCDECDGPHGRPTVPNLPGLMVSLSHAPGVVAAAAGPGPDPVGVDVERMDAAPTPVQAMAHVLAEPELRSVTMAGASAQKVFLRLWVRKEGLVKCGVATTQSLRALDLSSVPDNGTHAGGWHITDWEGTHPSHIASAVGRGRPRRVELAALSAGGGR